MIRTKRAHDLLHNGLGRPRPNQAAVKREKKAREKVKEKEKEERVGTTTVRTNIHIKTNKKGKRKVKAKEIQLGENATHVEKMDTLHENAPTTKDLRETARVVENTGTGKENVQMKANKWEK